MIMWIDVVLKLYIILIFVKQFHCFFFCYNQTCKYLVSTRKLLEIFNFFQNSSVYEKCMEESKFTEIIFRIQQNLSIGQLFPKDFFLNATCLKSDMIFNFNFTQLTDLNNDNFELANVYTQNDEGNIVKQNFSKPLVSTVSI